MFRTPATVAGDRSANEANEQVIRRYTEEEAREVIVRAGKDGARLVIDRDPLARGRERLLGQLGPDEPNTNAALLCDHYLRTPPERRRCRAPARADELAASSESPPREDPDWSVRGAGFEHALRAVPGGMSIPELRWTRTAGPGTTVAVSLRSAIALVEGYEPFCRYSRHALSRHADDLAVSTTTLATELTRVLCSPIVLNRGLREAVLTKVGRGEMTMSEIAIRCGRLKRGARGSRSGETSWLARRIGLLPEGGRRIPTPWVHTDVLALIARDGLGIAPREVELG
jgi:hypothetical protein